MLENTPLGRRSRPFPGNLVTAGRQCLAGLANRMNENERFPMRGGR